MLLFWVVLNAVVLSLLEGWDFFRALYFVVITVTTVGYGDEGISVAGRWIAVLTMLGGISVSSWAFAVMVQMVRLYGMDWRWRMQRRIDGVSNHALVAGFGEMGSVVAEELRSAGRTVVVIDGRDFRCDIARERGFMVVMGDATDEHILSQAGLERASEVLVCLDHAPSNVAIVLTARHLLPQARIVARVERPDESHRMRLAGADEVVCPTHSGAHDAARHVVSPGVADLLGHELGNHLQLGVAEVQVVAGSQLDGQLPVAIRGLAPSVSVVALVDASGIQHIPAPDRELNPGDVLVVVGEAEDVLAVRRCSIKLAAA